MPRHLAIGDIHGCFISLQTLCEFVGLESDDVIIPLGDYCNRGPNTYAVIDFLIRLGETYTVYPLVGNHEVMMLDARDDDDDLQKWIGVGGDATLRSYSPIEGSLGKLSDVPERHWEWMTENLYSFVETETHFFVHANAYPEIPLDDQPEFMLYWEKFSDPPRHESGKIMICGHTSQKSGRPLSNGNAICIDTWACGDGWLSCLHAESGMVWQANEKQETRKFWLDVSPDSGEE